MRRALVPVLLATLLAPLLPGCLRYIYQRERINEPVPEEAMEALAPGRELSECLATLGAPARVWRDPRGVWLAYIWVDQKSASISVSIPTGQVFLPGPSLSYGDIKRRGTGVTLCFDDDLRLRFASRGLTAMPDADPDR